MIVKGEVMEKKFKQNIIDVGAFVCGAAMIYMLLTYMILGIQIVTQIAVSYLTTMVTLCEAIAFSIMGLLFINLLLLIIRYSSKRARVSFGYNLSLLIVSAFTTLVSLVFIIVLLALNETNTIGATLSTSVITALIPTFVVMLAFTYITYFLTFSRVKFVRQFENGEPNVVAFIDNNDKVENTLNNSKTAIKTNTAPQNASQPKGYYYQNDDSEVFYMAPRKPLTARQKLNALFIALTTAFAIVFVVFISLFGATYGNNSYTVYKYDVAYSNISYTYGSRQLVLDLSNSTNSSKAVTLRIGFNQDSTYREQDFNITIDPNTTQQRFTLVLAEDSPEASVEYLETYIVENNSVRVLPKFEYSYTSFGHIEKVYLGIAISSFVITVAGIVLIIVYDRLAKKKSRKAQIAQDNTKAEIEQKDNLKQKSEKKTTTKSTKKKD